MAKMSKKENDVRIPDNLITLEEARKAFATNPNRQTFWRWTKGRGTGGVRLRVWKVVSRFYTTHEAIEEFKSKTCGEIKSTCNTKAGKPRKSMAIA